MKTCFRCGENEGAFAEFHGIAICIACASEELQRLVSFVADSQCDCGGPNKCDRCEYLSELPDAQEHLEA